MNSIDGMAPAISMEKDIKMKIESLKLVCFSPTGTSKTIVQAVARGINQGAPELIDITMPDARKQPLRTSEKELLVVAVPVYAGRVPALLLDWLNAVNAQDTPAVCIVVYGNREYDDALVELRDILKNRGCVPVACAAFIGEHSFSGSDTPIAVSRPDGDDLNRAETFGRQAAEKLLSISSVKNIQDIKVPGTPPCEAAPPLLPADFIAVSDKCTLCGICAESCPVGAIDLEATVSHDTEKCILCCACIKNCPENAITMKPGKAKDIAIRLSETCRKRKEPEFFL